MIDHLLALPSFVKIGVSFALILLVYRAGIPLGWSIVAAALALSLWTGIGLHAIAWQAHGFLLPENYLLFAVILFLLFFTESLSKSGRMGATVSALKRWLRSRKLIMGGLPALVGLLPMPGGALFSAPLVDSVDNEKSLEAPLKVAVNYWFRHIWEYWWPLYPGVILAIQYSQLPVGMYLAAMMPFTLLAVAGGYWFILRKIPRHESESRVEKRPLDIRAVRATLGPIFFLVAISVTGSMVLPPLGISKNVANLLSMMVGLGVDLVVLFALAPWALGPSMRMFSEKKTWSLMLVIAGVLMFSTALKMPLAHGQTLVSALRDDLFAAGVPVLAVMIVLPLVAGVVTGLAAGFVGASFPLVFALLPPNSPPHVCAATAAFCYSFGYIGMLLSPVHVCFVVTNEYFKSRLFKAYPFIVGPVAVILAGALLLSGFYLLIGRL